MDAPEAKSTKQERVHYIASTIANGSWAGYLSRVELAMRWGMTQGSIGQYAAQAHQMILADPEKLEQRRIEHALFCENLSREILERPNRLTGLPDWSAAIKARELAGRYEGIELDGRRDGQVNSISVQVAPVIMIPPERPRVIEEKSSSTSEPKPDAAAGGAPRRLAPKPGSSD